MRPETGGKNKTQKEFEEILLEVRRVTRVTTGGRRMSFRATVLVGNKKGKIGIGLSKGNDVTSAVKKASNEAYKNMFIVPITKADTVPYPIVLNYKACFVKLLPASAGTGLKAGSSVRSVLELAGYGNVLSKIIGSNNKLNNAIATIMALSKYKHSDHFNALHDKKAEKQVAIEDAGSKKVEEVVKMMDTTETLNPEVSKEAVVKVEKKVTAKTTEVKPIVKKTVSKTTKSNK
ncbi:MAG: hypothetical protein WAZ12_03580 [Candidatus Absconditicoccaceae bacterium]